MKISNILHVSERHTCLNTTATRCYYQCMLEVHGSERGAVKPDCQCTLGAAASPPIARLPSWCSSPNGTTCSWYQDCLEKRYPCQGKPTDYATKYAKHFCQLYDKSYHKFSTYGKAWIDSVRKCLQVALVPFLRPFSQATCSSIQTAAFASHTCCYTGGSSCSPSGAPSICSLPIADWWNVFWTIKSSFIMSTTSAAESFKGNQTGGAKWSF